MKMQRIHQFSALSHIEVKTKEMSTKSSKFPNLKSTNQNQSTYKLEIVWLNVTIFALIHLITLYGLCLTILEAKYTLFAFCYLMGTIMANGITAGAHRLWAHRSYKAKLPMRLILLAFQTAMFQNSVFIWVRDHRLHHKYTDTNADPHNAKRGFFFSHIGWLLCRKHPDVLEKGRSIDMSDIKADKWLMWQHKNYAILMPIFAFILPAMLVHTFFADGFLISFLFGGIMRYCVSVNYTWLVNSAAHLWGMKPYDKTIGPAENKLVSLLTTGEGWHNYHHVFPWDYKAAELGSYSLNLTLALINLCGKIGWAYDMKTVSPGIIQRRIERTGDGTWQGYKCKGEMGEGYQDGGQNGVNENLIWGWGDKEMDPLDIKNVLISNKLADE